MSSSTAVHDTELKIESEGGGDPAELLVRGKTTTLFQFAPKAVPRLEVGENLLELEIHSEAGGGEHLVDVEGLTLEIVWEENLPETSVGSVREDERLQGESPGAG